MTDEKAKELLENLMELQEKGQVADFPCPRCGHSRMRENLVENAISRRVKAYICSDCGMEEALLDMAGKPPLPLKEWGMILAFAEP